MRDVLDAGMQKYGGSDRDDVSGTPDSRGRDTVPGSSRRELQLGSSLGKGILIPSNPNPNPNPFRPPSTAGQPETYIQT